MNMKDILNKIEVFRDLSSSSVRIGDVPIISANNKDFDYNEDGITEFEEIIITFLRGIKNNFSQEDLTIFFNNLKDLKIEKKDKTLLGNSATYNAREKVITIAGDNYTEDIYHELFHVASSFVQNDTIYSGFFQGCYKRNKTIGRGLTEGYTQLLAERYFGDVTKKYYAYEVYVSKVLEKVIGKDVMEKQYINANLPGLINELAKYSSKEDIICFLNDLDFAVKYRYPRSIGLVKHDVLLKVFKNITYFLIKVYIKKLVSLVNNEDDYQLFNERIWLFVNSLYLDFDSFGVNFEIMTMSDVYEYINICLRNENMLLISEGTGR